MSDQEDDKKNIIEEPSTSNEENQSEVDKNNQPEGENTPNNNEATETNQDNDQNDDQNENLIQSNENNEENKTLETQSNETTSSVNDNNDQNQEQTEVLDASDEKKEENAGSSHQVIHKKDGRLHIYVRQDKYKGELKSKIEVGRLYIDGNRKFHLQVQQI